MYGLHLRVDGLSNIGARNNLGLGFRVQSPDFRFSGLEFQFFGRQSAVLSFRVWSFSALDSEFCFGLLGVGCRFLPSCRPADPDAIQTRTSRPLCCGLGFGFWRSGFGIWGLGFGV